MHKVGIGLDKVGIQRAVQIENNRTFSGIGLDKVGIQRAVQIEDNRTK